jgi:hypothetical protein
MSLPSPAHRLTTRTGPGRASSSARSTSRTKARRRGRLEPGFRRVLDRGALHRQRIHARDDARVLDGRPRLPE